MEQITATACEACGAEHGEEGYLCATCERTVGRRMDHGQTIAQVGRMTWGAVGARAFVKSYDSLAFTISRGHRRVTIRLALDDTYTVTTRMIRSGKVTFERTNVYCDGLDDAVWQSHIEH